MIEAAPLSNPHQSIHSAAYAFVNREYACKWTGYKLGLVFHTVSIKRENSREKLEEQGRSEVKSRPLNIHPPKMEHSPSVDNLLDIFWDVSVNFADKAVTSLSIDQRAPEWSFQEFFKESLTATPGLGPSRPACKSRFLIDHADVKEGKPEKQDVKESHRSMGTGADKEPLISSGDLQMYPHSGSSDFSTFMVTRSEDVRIVDDDDPCDAVEGALNPFFCGFPDVSEGSAAHARMSGTTIELNREDGFRNPQEYECFLKHKLEIACAAVAITQVLWDILLKYAIL